MLLFYALHFIINLKPHSQFSPLIPLSFHLSYPGCFFLISFKCHMNFNSFNLPSFPFMDGNEIQFELIQLLIMTTPSSQAISSLCSNPLFSCIVALYTLILVFYPYGLKFLFSPVLIFTSLLLLLLLRLGADQRRQIPAETEKTDTKVGKIVENRDTNLDSIERNDLSLDQIDNSIKSDVELDSQIPVEAEKNGPGNEKIRENRDTNLDLIEKDTLCLAQIDKWVKSQTQLEFESRDNFEHSFMEWNVRAPLEVIYEAYEGEEDDQGCGFSPIQSLSMYYPETDSDSSSDGGFPEEGGGWDSPESVYLKWEEEDKDGMLIEIALDSDGKHRSGMGFHFEEDNLIEIDISPRGNDSFNVVLA